MNLADIEPERRLWAAVVNRAVIDLMSPNERRQQSAASFFASRALDLVGNAAGLEPEEITRLRDLAGAGLLQFQQRRKRWGWPRHRQSAGAAPDRKNSETAPLVCPSRVI